MTPNTPPGRPQMVPTEQGRNLEVLCTATCQFPIEFLWQYPRQGFSVYEVPPDGAHELWSNAMISLFFLYFSLCCSVLLLLLHSAPSPTHDPLIFQYFIDHRCTLHFSAPLC